MPQRATTSSWVAPCQDCLARSRSDPVVAQAAAAQTTASAAARCALAACTLAMRASGLRYLAHRFADDFLAFAARYIAERDDADEALVAVDHRQAPDLVVAHVLGDMVELLVVEAVLNFRAHYLAHRGVGPLACRDSADGDVAVGDHADQAVVLAHRDRPGVDLLHDLGDLANALLGIGYAHVARHCLADSHGTSLGKVGRTARRPPP